MHRIVPSAGSPSPSPSPASGLQPIVDRIGALRAAADESRAATLEMLQGHGKVAIDLAQARSEDEALNLRRMADKDLADIRGWSKTEIARIQAETEERVAARTDALERDLRDHAARLVREVDQINTAVATFETQMGEFFSRMGSHSASGVEPARALTASVDAEAPAWPPSDPLPGGRTVADDPATPGATDETGGHGERPHAVNLASGFAAAESQAALDAAAVKLDRVDQNV